MFVLLLLLVLFYAVWYTGISNWKSNGAVNMTVWKALGIPQSFTNLLSFNATDTPPTISLSPQAQSAITDAQQVAGTPVQPSGTTPV